MQFVKLGFKFIHYDKAVNSFCNIFIFIHGNFLIVHLLSFFDLNTIGYSALPLSVKGPSNVLSKLM